MSKMSAAAGRLRGFLECLGLCAEYHFSEEDGSWKCEAKVTVSQIEQYVGKGVAQTKLDAESEAASRVLSQMFRARNKAELEAAVSTEARDAVLDYRMKAARAAVKAAGTDYVKALRRICLFVSGRVPRYSFSGRTFVPFRCTCNFTLTALNSLTAEGNSKPLARWEAAGQVLLGLGVIAEIDRSQQKAGRRPVRPQRSERRFAQPPRQEDTREPHIQHQPARWRRYPEEPQNIEAAS